MAAKAAKVHEQGKRAVDDLFPYARNPRTHSEKQGAQIAASIREFGFTNPVLVDEADTIIAGHGRVMAARSVGLKDVDVVGLTGLSDAQKRALVIADNGLLSGQYRKRSSFEMVRNRYAKR